MKQSTSPPTGARPLAVDDVSAPGADGVVLVAPLAPADRGNGLAMRAGMLLEALSSRVAVDVVIVPVAGPSEPHDWAAARARRVVVVAPVDASSADRHVVAQLADADLRSRLERTAPLPRRALLVPPTLAPEAAAALGPTARGAAAVLSMREYLVPFGVTLARLLGAARVVIDLDDDAERLLTELGELDEAAAYGRLARAWLHDADTVAAASPVDATSIGERYGVHAVETLPNAVHAPAFVGPAAGTRPGAVRRQSHLRAQRRSGPHPRGGRAASPPAAGTDRFGRSRRVLRRPARRLGGTPGVTLAGQVPDVAPWYLGADVVVVPLEFGAGTRIKVLEAFAYRRPVVATRAAVAGLAVTDGVEVVLAEGPAAIARATAGVLSLPGESRGPHVRRRRHPRRPLRSAGRGVARPTSRARREHRTGRRTVSDEKTEAGGRTRRP